MERVLLILSVIAMLVLGFGCSPQIVELDDIHDIPIRRNWDVDKVGAAIEKGATRAGWRTKRISDTQILAMYNIRNHRVIVTIVFSAVRYSIEYRNSLNMKIVCSADDDITAQTGLPVVTTGDDPCPNGATPQYIHEKYNEWIQQLSQSILRTIYATSAPIEYNPP